MKLYQLINKNNQSYQSNTKGTIGGHKKLKIYGRLDCPSVNRFIKKGHYIKQRVFFENETIAIQAGYRPCAKCMTKKYKEWKNKEIGG